MEKIYANVILVVVTVIWGGGFVAIDGVLDALSPFHIMVIRFVGTAAFPLLVCWKKLHRLDHTTIRHGIVTEIFLLLMFTFQTFGLKYSTPSKDTFLTATSVAFVPYLLWLLWYQHPSHKELITSLLCIVGIAPLMLRRDAFMLDFGDMLSLVCALSFALYITALGHYSTHVDTVCMIALQMTTAGAIPTVCALTLKQPPTSLNWHAAGNAAYLTFVSALLTYLLQTFAQGSITANSTSLILSMKTLFVSILSFLLLGEVMSPSAVLGARPIFSSILYIEYKPVRKKKDKQQDIC